MSLRIAGYAALFDRRDAELKSFVDGYLRHGSESELKSIRGTVLADGGYAVPKEIDTLIANQLKLYSPIRSIAQVVLTGTSGYRKLMTTGGSASGWVSEVAARPETSTLIHHWRLLPEDES